jgi:hypothetical protein
LGGPFAKIFQRMDGTLLVVHVRWGVAQCHGSLFVPSKACTVGRHIPRTTSQEAADTFILIIFKVSVNTAFSGTL